MMELKTNKASAGKNYKVKEMQGKLACGQITIAGAVGLSKKQMYAIAWRGFQLMNSGRLDEARQIYQGLVAADPYDSVFHCHLGAVLWRLGEMDKAFEEYDASLRFNLANIDALCGRGELFLQRGQIKEGIEDLRKAVQLDPSGERPATVRARALLMSLCRAVIKQSEQ